MDAADHVAVSSPGSAENPKLNGIADVDTDGRGKFKYVLIKVHDGGGAGEFKHVVRGYGRHEYHSDIYDSVAPAIEEGNLDCECVGGGRILLDPDKKTVHIYGHSIGYGKADHAITAAVVGRKYNDFSVTWSDEGY